MVVRVEMATPPAYKYLAIIIPLEHSNHVISIVEEGEGGIHREGRGGEGRESY